MDDSHAGKITRVSRPRRAAAATYSRLARWYDLLSLPERPIKRRAIALLAPQPGERVLVIGSGTGQELAAIAKAGAYAVGVDLAPGMCHRARARLAKSGLTTQAAPVCADALNLPLAEGACDAALAVFTLELFDTPDLPLVLHQIAQALRPGGRIVVTSLSRRRVNLPVRLYEWAHNRWPRYLDCRPILAMPLLTAAGWQVEQSRAASLCGLPVDIVRTRRPEGIGPSS